MSIMRYFVMVAGTAGLFLFPSPTAFAQQGASSAQSTIQLDVAVTTSKGKPAPALSANDFTVLDNKAQKPIVSFNAVQGKDAPVEVVIVVDAVNTPFNSVVYQRDQIVRYLRDKDGVLPYPTTFAVLTDKNVELYKGISKDGNALAAALNKIELGLRMINKSQGFYGAGDRMTISLNALHSLSQAEERQPGRKLVLWVSPGWPLLSGPHVVLDQKLRKQVYDNAVLFSTELRKANITLYSINSWGGSESMSREFYYTNFVGGLKRPDDAEWGNLALQVLAEQSGGLVVNSNDVTGMMKQCVDEANEYYRIVVAATPADGPNTYHQLEVKVSGGGLVARTRQGYYAQP